MRSLQEQYNLTKIGKLPKDVFLKEAKIQFSQYISNSMGFDSAVNILKQKSILREDSSYREPVKPKNEFESKFKSFLAEAKEEKSIKADLKKADKSVDDTNDAANYDSTDTKNADNVIFDQYMRGIYVEMSKDSKQDLETVKKKVLKNLTKDPIFYVKNGQFGVEGVGYSDELPGAKTAKDDKTIVLDKSKPKANVKDTLGKKEAAKGAPAKVKEMSSAAKNSKGVKKMAPPTKGKIIKLKENQSLLDLFEETDEKNYYQDLDPKAAIDKAKVDYDYAMKKGNEQQANKIAGNLKSHLEDKNYDWQKDPRAVDILADIIDENTATMNDEVYLKKLAKDLCNNESFAGDTSFDKNPDALIKAYDEDDIKAFYIEVFGSLPKSIPTNFSLNEGEKNNLKSKIKANYDEVIKLYDMGEEDLSYEELAEKLSQLLEAPINQVEKFLDKMVDISEDSPEEPETSKWLDTYLGKNSNLNERLSNIINKVMNEGGMEDADAQLAKQEADAEAKAAALSKQRADNKAKIAAANKNI